MADRLIMLNAALAELDEEQLHFATEQDALAFSANGVADPEDDLQTRCAAIYRQVRAELTIAYPWSWLTKRVALGEVPAGNQDDVGTWPWRYRYAIPVQDVASIRALYDESAVTPGSTNARLDAPRPRVDGWTVHGTYLYASFRPAWADVPPDVAEEAWPRLFENAMTQALAARLSMSIKDDLPTTRYYDQLAQRALANAKRVDAQSKPNTAITRFDWEEARFSGFGSYYHGV